MNFEKIAPYLQDPIVLVGFVLFLFFGLGRTIIRSDAIPTLTKAAGYRILSKLLLFGFVLALAIIAVGFGLKYRELSKEEQNSAVRLLNQELVGNLATVEELVANIENITRNTGIVSDVLRHPGIQILSTLFPKENLDPQSEIPASLDLARAQLQLAFDRGYLSNDVERGKFNQAAQAVAGMIGRTIGALESLADQQGDRYVIRSEVWDAHLPILRKVQIIDTTELQALYQEMDLLRETYSVVVTYSISYQKSLQSFFTDTETPVSPQTLASVLAAERVFVLTKDEYFKNATGRISEIEKILESIDLNSRATN